MDEVIIIGWIKCIWEPYVDAVPQPKLLLIDSYAAHMTSKVWKLLSKVDTEVEFIQPAFFSKLQLLDVG